MRRIFSSVLNRVTPDCTKRRKSSVPMRSTQNSAETFVEESFVQAKKSNDGLKHPEICMANHVKSSTRKHSKHRRQKLVNSSSSPSVTSCWENEFDTYGTNTLDIAASCNNCTGHLSYQLTTHRIAELESEHSRSCSSGGTGSVVSKCVGKSKKLLRKKTPDSWDFDIFKFSKESERETFAMLTLWMWDRTDIIKNLDLDQNKLYCFLINLQSTYKDNHYHTFVHAADVLHTCYYLTNQFALKEKIEPSKFDEHTSIMLMEHGSSFKSRFSTLDLISLYLAALMHDAGHPGRTNGFLINKMDVLAIR
ncbi:hypothetical protein ACOME3_009698 [Neoechinorhynchus agilis]